MKITILTSSYPLYRGDYAGIFVEKMALPLATWGHKVDVVAPGHPEAPRHENHANLQVWRFPYFLRAFEQLAYGPGGIPENLRSSRLMALLIPFFMLGFLIAAWKRSAGADVIHANWTLPAGWVARLVGKRRGVPYVLTARGSDIQLAKKSSLAGRLCRPVLMDAALVTTVSEALREEVIAMGVPPGRVRVIPSGVAVKTTRPRGQDRPELPRPRGVFVGSLRELKGVDVLIEAMAKLRDRGTLHSLWIVGDGPEREKLEDLVRKLRLTDRIAFTGRVPHDEVGSWMAEADYMVLPSFSEGRPNVVYEAFAVGTPVVATNIPGTSELIADGERGLLVPVKDSAALAEAMEKVGGNEVLSQHLAEMGSAWLAAQGLTWDACARSYLAAYEAAVPAS
ncbi:MAG: glycosyltransferase [Chrysiogenetes bacterium]|nr:glycosyltransferase [Chrysiogenetes bacterium]